MPDFDSNYTEVPVLARVGQKVVLFNEKNEVLFLRRSQKCTRPGGWDFPGGGIDFGEDPLTAITREIIEETQLSSTELKPIHLTSFVTEDDEFVIMVGYTAKTSDTSPTLSWEHDDFKWLQKKEALTEELPEIHKSFLQKALAED